MAKKLRIMHSPTRQTAARAGRHGKAPRRHQVTAQRFRDARVFGGLTREQAAALLGVSLRTIGHWETGRTRVAWAAFKLLRVFRHGVFPDPAWAEYRIVRGRLVTPEGHSFEPHEIAWLSLLVRRARAFSELRIRAEHAGAGAPEARRAMGLSTYPTKQKRVGVHNRQPAPGLGSRDLTPATHGATMGPQWPHDGATGVPHGGHEEDQLAYSGRAVAHGEQPGGADGHLGQCLCADGDSQLHPVPGTATATAGGGTVARIGNERSDLGQRYVRCDAQGAGRAPDGGTAGPQGGGESGVSMRQRGKVQAVPRAAVAAGGAA